jgi:predicted nucleic acid-binding protein
MEEAELKSYLLDTNGFRYLTNPKENKDIKKAAKAFWKHAIEEIQDGKAILVIPKEVARELEVQSFSLPGGEKQYARIADLLEEVEETLPDISTPEIEHQIRKISAYIGEEFRESIRTELDVAKVKYGGVSDIRILYTAWQYDCILVTGNVKDFVLYPLLFTPEEDRLFDIISGTYKKYSLPTYTKVTTDPVFEGMMQELQKSIDELINET